MKSSYGNNEEEWKKTVGIELISTGSTADRFLNELRSLLTQRQAKRKEEPDAVSPPVFFLIDGYRRFFDEISQQSADRLS